MLKSVHLLFVSVLKLLFYLVKQVIKNHNEESAFDILSMKI